jgi:hypothetical protein
MRRQYLSKFEPSGQVSLATDAMQITLLWQFRAALDVIRSGACLTRWSDPRALGCDSQQLVRRFIGDASSSQQVVEIGDAVNR